MFGRKKPEVLVVGAGPVGLMAALTLARRGVRVQIIDEAWRPAAHAYALALHPGAMALLDRLGVAQAVREVAYPVRGLGLFRGAERRERLDLAGLDAATPYVAVFRQSLLEDLLTAELAKLDVKVEWNHRLARMVGRDEHVDVTINRLEKDSVGYAVGQTEWMVASAKDAEVPFVIGADGHRSLVRRRLEVGFPEVGRAQHFAVFEFSTDADLDHEMAVVLNEGDSNVVWPLPDGRVRWSFELPGYDHPEDDRHKNRLMVELAGAKYPMLDEDHLHELLATRAPWFKGRVSEVKWRLVVRFERRLADAFGVGRVWLAGDAGHMTSPVGVQSMNVGLAEAHELGVIMADALQGKVNAKTALDAYGAGRLAEWKRLFGKKGGYAATEATPAWLAPYAGELAAALPASGAGLDALLGQVGVRR